MASIRVFFKDELLYEGPRVHFSPCLFTKMFEHENEIDVSTFPGAGDPDLIRKLLEVISKYASESERRKACDGFTVHEALLAIEFFDFLNVRFDRSIWIHHAKCATRLPDLLILSALAAGSPKLQLVRMMTQQREKWLKGANDCDIAIPYSEAVSMFARAHLLAEDTEDFEELAPVPESAAFTLPHDLQGAFTNAFPWFPSDFEWEDPSSDAALGIWGGAAGNILHGNGCGDLDFFVYSRLGEPIRDASQIIGRAISSFRRCAAEMLVLDNPMLLTLAMRLLNGMLQQVDIVKLNYSSVSDALLGADVDAAQVAYCGGDKLFLSPLAIQAYSKRFISIRSEIVPEGMPERLVRYSSRGFGLRAAKAIIETAGIQTIRDLLRPGVEHGKKPYQTIAPDVACLDGYNDIGVRVAVAVPAWQSAVCPDSTQTEKTVGMGSIDSYDRVDIQLSKALQARNAHSCCSETVCIRSSLPCSRCVGKEAPTGNVITIDMKWVYICHSLDHFVKSRIDLCDPLKWLGLRRLCCLHPEGAFSIAGSCPASSAHSDSDNTDPVVHEIVHEDAATTITPDEAAAISMERWATAVEHLSRRDVQCQTEDVPSCMSVVVLEFNRDPRVFDDILIASAVAVRASLFGGDVKPDWANGAKVLVPVIRAEHLDEVHVKLTSRHVIAYERDVPAILETLQALPSKTRPRLKPHAYPITVPDAENVSCFRDVSFCHDGVYSSIGTKKSKDDANGSPEFGLNGEGLAHSYVMDISVKWTFLHVELARASSDSGSGRSAATI
jgi:hypothetical protein